jgi:hypothetical protein
MLVVPAASDPSGLRRWSALLGALLAVTACSGCMSDEPAPGPATPSPTVGPTAGEDTTSAPGVPSATGSSRSSRTAASPDQPGIAAATVSRFYSAYIAAPSRKTAAEYLVPPLLADLFDSPKDVDRVLCSHALPNAISVTPGAVSGANVTVSVTTTQQGAARPPIRVTVRTKDQRIVGIACPA